MSTPQFSSSNKIQRRETIWTDFLEQVLNLPWAFVSDASCLQDFEGLMDADRLIQRVRVRYGLGLLSEHLAMPLYQFLELLELPPKT